MAQSTAIGVSDMERCQSKGGRRWWVHLPPFIAYYTEQVYIVAQLTRAAGDRIHEHMRDFNEYKSVGIDGSNLGYFLEVGAGPWTQSLAMMRKRSFTVEKYAVMEPGALAYAAHTPSTVYRSGQIVGFDGKTIVINAGGEHLDLFAGVFDTIMMINVLEHVNNGIRILRGLYNALKPGGLLIFNDRWHNPSPNQGVAMDLNTLYHPIRMKKAIFLKFLSGFDKLHGAIPCRYNHLDIYMIFF
jgi:SAM-dependent methyltransferase